MLTLYELRWSHYCEKIRLALAYMELPYQAVAIEPFNKPELRRFKRPRHLPNVTVPALQMLQALFARQAAIFQRYSKESDFPYQQAILAARNKRPPYRRKALSQDMAQRETGAGREPGLALIAQGYLK